MVNWHPLGTIWHPKLEGPGRFFFVAKFPLVVGNTSPTAFAAPVAEGMMLQDAARPPRQSWRTAGGSSPGLASGCQVWLVNPKKWVVPLKYGHFPSWPVNYGEEEYLEDHTRTWRTWWSDHHHLKKPWSSGHLEGEGTTTTRSLNGHLFHDHHELGRYHVTTKSPGVSSSKKSTASNRGYGGSFNQLTGR